MKVIAFLIAFTSSAAFANSAVLTYESSSVTPNPRFTSRTVCTIGRDKVSQATFGGYGSGVARETKIAWTMRVPNMGVLKNLLLAAQKARVVSAPGPTDAPSRSWTGTFVAPNARYAPITLLKVGPVRARNNAPSARVLVEFMNFNCNQ